ncbi:hypothetical protein DKE50_013380 [Acinetobacter nosocomialis]|nr:hypothetical protein DKE50_013380 [Acinetobacter nosocomialis]
MEKLLNVPPWGIPFPAPALSSEGGTMKRYLATDVMKWEEECQQKKQLKKSYISCTEANNQQT